MSEIMMVRNINSKIIKEENLSFYKCKTFSDLCSFVRVYMLGFNLRKYKYILYLLNNINFKYENYIVYKDNNVVGCFSLYFDEDFVCLYDFAILNEYRGKGLGNDCLIQIINKVYDKGYNELYLFVSEKNITAINLYKKHNFYFCEE